MGGSTLVSFVFLVESRRFLNASKRIYEDLAAMEDVVPAWERAGAWLRQADVDHGRNFIGYFRYIGLRCCDRLHRCHLERCDE